MKHLPLSYSQLSTLQMSNNTKDEEDVQILAKQMLYNRLFVGHYQERRYVDLIKNYRDVVVVSSQETDLLKAVEVVKQRIEGCYDLSRVWLGITGPDTVGAPVGYSLWVKLRNVAFGQYWFQVKQVKFTSIETILVLKVIRAYEDHHIGNIKVKTQQNEGEVKEQQYEEFVDLKAKWDSLVLEWKNFFANGLISVLTVSNVKNTIVFLSLLLVTVVTGLFHSVRYIGDYSLRLFREVSILIGVMTPIFLAIIDFLSKCVGGLYILLAMMWRGSNAPPPSFQRSMHSRPSITQGPYRPKYRLNSIY